MKPEILTHIHNKPIYRKAIRVLPYNKELSLRARALRKAGKPCRSYFLEVGSQ